MKKIIFLSMLLFLGATFLSAQSRTPKGRMSPEQQATQTVERLNKELKLTDKQKNELQEWFTDSFKKRNEEFQKKQEDREAMKEAMQKDRQETEARLKEILTGDQYKKYQENEKKRREELKERVSRHGKRRW